MPLSNIRILDFTKLLPGPLATNLLADLGAEIIKIESPESPDTTRFYPPFVGEMGVNFTALNSNKTLLSLDYKSVVGKSEFFELLKTADVVIEQFRPGIMTKWGIDYESARQVKSDIIYISITGYGQDGPNAHLAGHDLNYLALSGVLALNVDDTGKPVIPGIQVADVAGGSYLAMNAVMAALLKKNATGKGSHISVSMLDGLMPMMALNMAHHWAGEELAVDKKTFLSGRLANYNVYACADGKHIALGALEPKFWAAFCQTAERLEWENLLLPTEENQDFLKKELSAFFSTKSRDEWVAFFEHTDCCLSPVLLPSEVEDYPHHLERGLLDKEGFRVRGALRFDR
jgi:alpha-methylacyl-CoA racemase